MRPRTAPPDGGQWRHSPLPGAPGSRSPKASTASFSRRLLWCLVLVATAIGALGVAGLLSGWVWPLLFLVGAVVVGVLLGRRPWLVVGMVVATGVLLSAPDGAVRFVGTLWMWVAAHVGAAALLSGARRWVGGAAALLWLLAVFLPRGEREPWRAEVRSVLHACGDDHEVRRQVLGFLSAAPATVLTSWRVRR